MIVALGTLLGGIGLFLLGMHHLTDGLKQSAGNRLEEVLNRSTRTKARGFGSGFFLTALVQASGVVTVATIGFVNAGLLNMGQAVWVVFGSNVGTTMTSWIVAIVGFKIKVEVFALPIVGVGAFLHILSPSPKWRAIGGALAGFGLLFVGLGLLQGSLEAYKGSFELMQSWEFDTYHVLLLLGIGFLLTVLLQSSSASMAMILLLVNAGVIPLALGAAAVIGANIGTTSTAVLATIGATPNAKRVAWSHVLFNAIAGAAALALLPLVSGVFTRAYEQQLAGGNAAFWLAIYHTLFNLVGVLLMIPLEPKLTRFLERRFKAKEQVVMRLKFLDNNVIGVPALALQATLNELRSVTQILATETRTLNSEFRESETIRAVQNLLSQMDEIYVKILRQPMLENIADRFSNAIKCNQNMRNVLEIYSNLSEQSDQFGSSRIRDVIDRLVIAYSNAMAEMGELNELGAVREKLKSLTEQAKQSEAEILNLIKAENLPEKEVSKAIAWVAKLQRICRQWSKILRRIDALNRAE